MESSGQWMMQNSKVPKKGIILTLVREKRLSNLTIKVDDQILYFAISDNMGVEKAWEELEIILGMSKKEFKVEIEKAQVRHIFKK